MDLILLIVCSIIIARCLERRMRVASVAHSIMFIVLAFFMLFTTNFALINQAMINIFGENIFNIVREALIDGSHLYRGTFSVLFFIDVVIDVIACITAIVVSVKAYKKFFKNLDIKKVRVYIDNFIKSIRLLPNKVLIENNRNQYLVLQQLRN